MKISHTDRLGVWLFADLGRQLRPWWRCGVGLVEGGALGVCAGAMWVPRRKRDLP